MSGERRILVLAVECEWSSAMYKSKGFRMAAWGSVRFALVKTFSLFYCFAHTA